ncbi:MAG: hypothetical protein Q9214_004793 [Letrouitia sp. 1 TL-2023]
MMARFIYLTFVFRSVRAAAQGAARERFGDISDEAENSLDQVEKNTIFRVALFVLGALPQLLKLYGLSGVTWPKVWASVFLSSFVTTEIIILLIGRDWEKVPIKKNTLQTWMSLIHVTSWVYDPLTLDWEQLFRSGLGGLPEWPVSTRLTEADEKEEWEKTERISAGTRPSTLPSSSSLALVESEASSASEALSQAPSTFHVTVVAERCNNRLLSPVRH